MLVEWGVFMGKYCLRNIDRQKELYYVADAEEKVAWEYYEWFQRHGKVDGFAPITITEDGTSYRIRYALEQYSTLEQYLEFPIEEETLLELIYRIVNAIVRIEESDLPIQNLIWNLNGIFIEKETLEIRFIYHMFQTPPEKGALVNYIAPIINQSRIVKVEHNVKQFLINYLEFQPNLCMRDFEIFLHNMISKFQAAPVYSGSMSLSCSLQGEQLVLEENAHEIGSDIIMEQSREAQSELNSKASLIRLRNRERIPITKDEYRVGKESCNVEYCIVGNAAISRCHAMIICRNGEYYIRDLGSTNHTYVDNIKILGAEEARLRDGAKVTLANEVFRFEVDGKMEEIEKASIPF